MDTNLQPGQTYETRCGRLFKVHMIDTDLFISKGDTGVWDRYYTRTGEYLMSVDPNDRTKVQRFNASGARNLHTPTTARTVRLEGGKPLKITQELYETILREGK